MKYDSTQIRPRGLRRRCPKLLQEVYSLPRAAWRQVELDVPTRQNRTPRVYEQCVQAEGHWFRQIFVMDLGHDKPAILLTNQHQAAVQNLVTRYAHRMLIENSLTDAVRFFHLDALSSAVGLKVDFDQALPGDPGGTVGLGYGNVGKPRWRNNAERACKKSLQQAARAVISFRWTPLRCQ